MTITSNAVSTMDSQSLAPVTSLVPELAPPAMSRRPESAEQTLAGGLRVIAIRQPGVPLVEMRLRIPFSSQATEHLARASVLSQTMLTGTENHNQVQLAQALQELGADLSVSGDVDRLNISGSALASELPAFLALVKEVLTSATYPADEVANQRRRLVETLSISRSMPAVLSREALRQEMFGQHPYATEIPEIAAVSAVDSDQLRQLHADRVVRDSAVLVLSGDLDPAGALQQVDEALAGWRSSGQQYELPDLPEVTNGPLRIVNRPGSVQSSIRLGAPALTQRDPAYPALHLANLVFGGCFSSRLVANLREDKGYTYSPHTRVEHAVKGSRLLVDADVATEVTAPALLETIYELGRIASLPVRSEELEGIRQYAIGALALSTSTQAGLASVVSGLTTVGLGLEWLWEYPARLAAVTLDEVNDVAQRMFAPSRMFGVVLGDADLITEPLARLSAVHSG